MRNSLSILLVCLPLLSFSQVKGKVIGTVKDKNTQEFLIGTTLILKGADTLYAVSSVNGDFEIAAPVGTYTFEANNIGYSSITLFNINVNSGNAQVLDIELEPKSFELGEVSISLAKSVQATDMVTPLATQKLTADEIKLNPGGNFDVSKVIQVLPGVAGGTTANRNDIIVRGGGPSENVYYLDGIEIPVLNHFQTQGASGGATGILNVSFINDVQLTSSAFDSRYDNALASTFVIRQRNGNPNQLGGNIRLSGSELATTFEGPIGSKTTFMASGRRSYLQFLFKILDLPIRPDYWDFQYKVNHRINKKTELTFIGLGAIDNFRLAAPKDADAENEYILRANPLIKQWNYTTGASLKRLFTNGFLTVALSRNMFFNGAERFENNADKTGRKLYELGSHEIENKLRIDVDHFLTGWKLSYGMGLQYVKYDAKVSNTLPPALPESSSDEDVITTHTALDFFKAGVYTHTSKYFWNETLLVSGGFRSDINTYTHSGKNPFETFSPRLSASYAMNSRWNISGSVGSYYKLPTYTALGYVDREGLRRNQELKYINSIHYTLGTQFIPRNDFRFTFEAFYKRYRNYPVSLTTGISLANVGTDFAAVGNEPYTSSGVGRVYGVEAYVQQKLIKNLFYVASATVYKSEFAGADGRLLPSTWDYGYVISSTLGYKFKGNWDLGLKYRIAGGQPYTPFDRVASQLNYLTNGQGVYDYALLNSERLPLFQQLDIRLDKKFNFKKTSLIFFLDFQNLLRYKAASLPKFTFERNEDNTGFATTDGRPVQRDGSNAIPLILEQRSATFVPSIGFIFEF